jgi:hypothetical protein
MRSTEHNSAHPKTGKLALMRGSNKMRCTTPQHAKAPSWIGEAPALPQVTLDGINAGTAENPIPRACRGKGKTPDSSGTKPI